MTMTIHLPGPDPVHTACGMRNISSDRVQGISKVTCRRCLKTIPDTSEINYPASGPIVAAVQEAAKLITRMASFEKRASALIKRLAEAQKAGEGLTLSASEVDDIALVLFMLNANK